MWAIQSEIGSVRYFWIPGFDAYVIGDDGSLWSRNQRVRGRWVLSNDWTRMRVSPVRGGYLGVTLCFNGIEYPKVIHKLVCEAVHGPRPVGQEVRHIDGVRSNNHWQNLHYGTSKDNKADMVVHGTVMVGDRNHQAKLTWKEVREIREKYATGKYTHVSLGLEYGVSKHAVYLIVNNLSWIE